MIFFLKIIIVDKQYRFLCDNEIAVVPKEIGNLVSLIYL